MKLFGDDPNIDLLTDQEIEENKMPESDDTKRQKIESLLEIRDMVHQLINSDNFNKFHYQDLRHIRNSMRKALREAGLR